MNWINLTLAIAAALSARAQAANTVTGELGDAVIVSNNPPGVAYIATLPSNKGVKGVISATAGPAGVGVSYTVSISNLPISGGPFPYHLHVGSVPEDGNCTKTLTHLDPYIRGEATPCDKNSLQTCQVGDLSGKYGTITSDPFTTSFTDPYTSTLEGLGSFFGNRSIVIHFANKTRITCANFARVNIPVNPVCVGVGNNQPAPTLIPVPIKASNTIEVSKPTTIGSPSGGNITVPTVPLVTSTSTALPASHANMAMVPTLPLLLVAGLAWFL